MKILKVKPPTQPSRFAELILWEIVKDWQCYHAGVGNCYPPDESEYQDLIERMQANMTDAEEYFKKFS
jgi:hypothetical protein